jgi:hypothetical protein
MAKLSSAEITKMVEARLAAEQRDCGCYLGSARKARRRIREAVMREFRMPSPLPGSDPLRPNDRSTPEER